MATKTDIRQFISRDTLTRTTGAAGSQLDAVIRALESEITPPLALSATGANRVLTIGNITVTNPSTSLKRTVPPISNLLPAFTSGTVTMSATGAGTATPSVGSAVSLGMTASQFMRIGVSIDPTGTLLLTKGTAAASLAAAGTPAVPSGLFAIGHVVVRTDGSNNVANVLVSDIYQYVGGGGGSGSGSGSSIVARLEDKFADSIFQQMSAVDFATDASTHVDGTSTGAYSLVKSMYSFSAGAQTLVTTQLLSPTDFLTKGYDLPRVSATVMWNEAGTDTAATYALSRNGGVDWQTISMTRVGTTDTYEGDLTFTDETPAVLQQFAVSNADGTQVLNTSTDQKLSQIFTVAADEVVKQVTMYLSKTGTPTGNYFVSIVRNSAGSPSTALSDILATTTAQLVSSLSSGNNAVSITLSTPLPPGSYHLVLETDQTYKNSWVTSTTEIAWRSDASAPSITVGQHFNGTAWSALTEAFCFQVSGRLLDLRLRVTSSAGSVDIAGYGVYYDIQTAIASGVKNREVKYFLASANTSSFALGFLPDPDLLQVFYVESGQTFVYPAFTLQGQTVIFPANTFNNGGLEANITLVFSQRSGSSFDNSDGNAALLAANRLGSSDATVDRSVAGRGIILRRPDGTLREIAIDNNDNITISTVP